jgi:acyl-ACP thioesterase
MLLDIKTREIRKAESISFNSSPIKKERAIDCKLGRLKALGELETEYRKLIGYSDIDFNGHINNSKYVDYAMDCFDVKMHKKYGVKSIEINYIDEALPEDVLVLYKNISPLNANLSYIEGMNEKSGKIVFKSQIEFGAKWHQN